MAQRHATERGRLRTESFPVENSVYAGAFINGVNSPYPQSHVQTPKSIYSTEHTPSPPHPTAKHQRHLPHFPSPPPESRHREDETSFGLELPQHFQLRGARGRQSALVPSGTPLFRTTSSFKVLPTHPETDPPRNPQGLGQTWRGQGSDLVDNSNSRHTLGGCRAAWAPTDLPGDATRVHGPNFATLCVATAAASEPVVPDDEYLTIPPTPCPCGSNNSILSSGEASHTPPVSFISQSTNNSGRSTRPLPPAIPSFPLDLRVEDSPGMLANQQPEGDNVYCNSSQPDQGYQNSPRQPLLGRSPPPLPPRVPSAQPSLNATRPLPLLPEPSVSSYRSSSHTYNSLYGKINCCHANGRSIRRWLPTLISILMVLILLSGGLLVYTGFKDNVDGDSSVAAYGGEDDRDSSAERKGESSLTDEVTTHAHPRENTTTVPPTTTIAVLECPVHQIKKKCKYQKDNTGTGPKKLPVTVIIPRESDISKYERCTECCDSTIEYPNDSINQCSEAYPG